MDMGGSRDKRRKHGHKEPTAGTNCSNHRYVGAASAGPELWHTILFHFWVRFGLCATTWAQRCDATSYYATAATAAAITATAIVCERKHLLLFPSPLVFPLVA
ncbi:hypothetical protein Vafri_15197 [Volvox africanus]|uniref:Uncharacterized protein n=1 Tax=Volvox africanus TaxID=51714 RepID=A0A8J4F5H7_9CHLO|nr:hypothetical protein Vafri_15197 [Volvox africanus]